MTISRTRLPDPVRRVLVANDSVLVIELEGRVMQLRGPGDTLELRCMPNSPGECLLWPIGTNRCAMLAPDGAVKVYQVNRLVELHTELLRPGDEVIEARLAGDRTALLLVGRRVEDPLSPAAEYRFVWAGAAFERLGVSVAAPRPPRAWAWDDARQRVLALDTVAEPAIGRERPLDEAPTTETGEQARLTGIDLGGGTTETIGLPGAVRDAEVTGMSFDPGKARLALTIQRGTACTLAVLDPATGNHKTLATVRGRMTAPLWSPDRKRIAFTEESSHGLALMLFDAVSGRSRPLCRLAADAETAWLDSGTLVVSSWETLDWVVVDEVL
jgi:hypothetical protein